MASSSSPKSEIRRLASHILFKDHALKLARCLSSLEENRIHLARPACWVQGSFGLSCLSPLLSLRESCRQFAREGVSWCEKRLLGCAKAVFMLWERAAGSLEGGMGAQLEIALLLCLAILVWNISLSGVLKHLRYKGKAMHPRNAKHRRQQLSSLVPEIKKNKST